MTEPGRQIALALGPFQSHRLFAEHFLRERLPDWSDFRDRDPAPLYEELGALWRSERESLASANEAQTEERFVQPVLRALGFSYTVQAGLRVGSGRRQPDYALFLSDADRAAAETAPDAGYERAVAVADAKRFDRPLERRMTGGSLSEDPVAQIIHYVAVTRRPWGILTNGRLWRLYGAQRELMEGACLEFDLVALLESGDEQAFRYFAAFLSADAFRAGLDGRSFLDRALEESTAGAVQVGEALQRQVYAAVPLIAEGLLDADERTDDALASAFDHSLVLLYRLLFCLYAEARDLLPIENPHYREYSLRAQREELAADIDRGRVFSSASDDLYNDLRALFRIVDRGEEALGVPQYNGGLFSAEGHPYFRDRAVPDRLLAPALDGLYRVAGEQVDYRDLSVRHLGTLYERLLDWRVEDRENVLVLVPATGRHDTGSYFTPGHVVDRIVERTIEPLLERRSKEIADAGLSGADALARFLDLKVLDPAMGSGHFLVAAGAYMAQFVATDPSYGGDLELADIERLVAERCLYGVDLNPMAVELAQLSLWLATVRGGEPLTFLANLRHGNSLVGTQVEDLLAGGETIFSQRLARDAEGLLAAVGDIRARESRTGDDVHAKEELAAAADALREPLEAYADEQLSGRFSDGVGRFFHWQLEFPEVFLAADGRPRPGAGFDAVLGNPPYVRIQALGRELAAYCRERYDFAHGSFDVYVPFIERGLSLLSGDGRLGFIVPNKLTKLDYARRMRERLASDGAVEEIVDFGDAQVFAGATNYTCILVLDRRGGSELAYRRVSGGAGEVRRALVDVDALPAQSFRTGPLGGDPWVLAAGEEASLLRHLTAGAERLDEVTGGIFTGLQTNADKIYILEDRGRRGGRQAVYSRASERELELEPGLLHPLASGGDVDRFAFRPLGELLLFPYRREGDAMRLLSAEELARLTATADYLAEHEQALRGRERGKMDHDRWYAYVYPKSLGAHDLAKLGVPRLCEHLRASADPGGSVYLDNVDVNGILLREGGASIWTLVALLNSRVLDWLFRRFSVPFRGAFMSANKQFIAPLPIRRPDGPDLDELGRRMHEHAAAIGAERRGFLDWLEGRIGVRLAGLPGSTALLGYDEQPLDRLLDLLRRSESRLSAAVGSRSFREELAGELSTSLDRLAPLRAGLEADVAAAERAIFDLYGLSRQQRELLERDYA